MLQKSFKTAVFVLAGFIFFTGCTSSAHIEKAKEADLSRYKTYGWVEKQKLLSKDKHNEIAQQNIQAAVDKQLEKSGWRKVDNNPDVLVSTDLVVEKTEKEQNDPMYSRPYTRTFFNRYSRRFNTYYFPSQFMGYDRYTTPVKEGTVTVTLIDAKTDKAVWQGWATRELRYKNISDRDIDKNVQSIFKKFDAGN